MVDGVSFMDIKYQISMTVWNYIDRDSSSMYFVLCTVQQNSITCNKKCCSEKENKNKSKNKRTREQGVQTRNRVERERKREILLILMRQSLCIQRRFKERPLNEELATPMLSTSKYQTPNTKHTYIFFLHTLNDWLGLAWLGLAWLG